jgi:predicted unusual protein kinase regulating ubiquinone biosynthesis (AarF/ABC1/UbiB family)
VEQSLASGTLARLGRPLRAAGVGDVETAISDFTSWLRRITDLRQEARDLERLAEESEDIPALVVSEVLSEFSGSRWLTTVTPRGVLPHPQSNNALRLPPRRRARYARRLSRTWLKLALTSPLFLEEPSPRNVLFLSDGSIAICGGPLHASAGSAQDHLRSYLAATTVEDHKRIWEEILELSDERSGSKGRTLRHKLRHSAPFRDGGFDPQVDRLTRTVFAHWHQCAALGYKPRPTTLAFLRGLGYLARFCHQLAPEENVVRESFQELRLRDLLNEFARATDGGEWAELVRRQASVLTDLPRKIERVLASTDRTERLTSNSSSPRPRAGGSWPLLSGLLAATIAVVLVVLSTREASSLSEPIGSLAVLLFGALSLWLSGKG